MEALGLLKRSLPALLGLLGVLLGSWLTAKSQERITRLSYEEHLRLAALDKRLEKHQEAFTLWRRLFLSIHSEHLDDIIYECQEWWASNCIYLSPGIDARFLNICQAAGNHPYLIAVWKDSGSKEDSDKIKRNFRVVEEFGRQIRTAVGLPEIVDPSPERVNAFGDT